MPPQAPTGGGVGGGGGGGGNGPGGGGGKGPVEADGNSTFAEVILLPFFRTCCCSCPVVTAAACPAFTGVGSGVKKGMAAQKRCRELVRTKLERSWLQNNTLTDTCAHT